MGGDTYQGRFSGHRTHRGWDRQGRTYNDFNQGTQGGEESGTLPCITELPDVNVCNQVDADADADADERINSGSHAGADSDADTNTDAGAYSNEFTTY